jgi:hypothetical protein
MGIVMNDKKLPPIPKSGLMRDVYAVLQRDGGPLSEHQVWSYIKETWPKGVKVLQDGRRLPTHKQIQNALRNGVYRGFFFRLCEKGSMNVDSSWRRNRYTLATKEWYDLRKAGKMRAVAGHKMPAQVSTGYNSREPKPNQKPKPDYVIERVEVPDYRLVVLLGGVAFAIGVFSGWLLG